MHKYRHVILGGTFDHFHLGHQSIIDSAFRFGQKITLGICQGNLYQDKFLSSIIEDYETRQRSVLNYLKSRGLSGRSKIVAIDDIYGTAKTDPTIEALIATKATCANALKVNKLRQEIGFKPLKIITAPFIKGDDGEVITSERIRLGEIDRGGHSYLKDFIKEKLILPQNLKEELRRPFGMVIDGGEEQEKEIAEELTLLLGDLQPTMTIAVGDFVSRALLSGGFDPDVKIIDFKIRRQAVDDKTREFFSKKTSLEYINEPGTLGKKAVFGLKKAIDSYLKTKEKQLVIINGEEDLLALPTILFSPLKSAVIYGQKDLGVVAVEVSEEKKKKVVSYIGHFTF